MRDLQSNPDAIHKFERAGLGKAPFKFVGCTESKFQAAPGEPIKPGSSCDYCAAAIMCVYWVESSDGRKFKVGCDCIEKVGDAGLMKLVSKEIRKHNREVRHSREALQVEELKKLLTDSDVRAKLSSLPHPYKFENQTLLSWAIWMLDRGGNSGKIRALKQIKKTLKGD